MISTAAISLIVACSGNKSPYTQSDIGGLNQTFNPNSNENNALKNYVEQINGQSDEASLKQQALLKEKVILITAGGLIYDQSFHQSAWEAISKFSQEIGNDQNRYYQTTAVSESVQFAAYDYALAKGFKFWILMDFQQQDFLPAWLKIGQNAKRLIDSGVRIITIDWFLDQPELAGRVLGLNFKTQEAAFTASYAASQLLKEANADKPELFPNKSVKMTTFAGSDFLAATNFNYGFYEGMRQFNQDNLALSEPAKQYFVQSTTPLELNAGFAINNDTRATANREVEKNGQIVFPVAGSLAAAALDHIKERRANQWFIGVDSDQSRAFPADQGLILTSVEKRIAIAVYKALLTIYKLTGYDAQNGNLSILDDMHTIDDQGIIRNQNQEAVNLNVIGGFKDGFVGVSPSTLDGQKWQLNINGQAMTYAQRYDQIVANVWQEFYGQANQPGRFETPKNQQINGKNGLLPDVSVINDFNQAMEEWKTIAARLEKNEAVAPSEINANAQKILALENPLFGYMTGQNQLNYFDPVVQKINKFVTN